MSCFNCMPKNLALLLVALVASTSMAAASEPASSCVKPINLLENGGFEQGEYAQNAVPAPWTWDAWAGQAIPNWDDTQAQSGRRSVKISATVQEDARFLQRVQVKQQTPYVLSGWIKSEGVAHSPQSVDVGANISLMGDFTYAPGLIGTQDWTRTEVMFTR